MSTDELTSDPRAPLAAAIEAVAAAGSLEAALDGVLAAAKAGLHPSMGAIFVSDPDRPGLQIVASIGLDGAAQGQLSTEVADPADPFTTAAASRVATFGREAIAADGSSSVGAYLPLVVSSAGVETTLGSLGLSWSAPRVLGDVEREVLGALATLAALAVDRARLASTASERSEWFERMAPHGPAHGARQRADDRPRPRAGAGAGRPAGQ